MRRSVFRFAQAALVASGLALTTTAAEAGGIYTVTPEDGTSVFGTPNWSETATIDYNGNRQRVRAGLFRFNLDDGMGSNFDLATFCVQIAQSLSLPNAYSEQAFDPNTIGSVNALWSNAFSLVQDSSSAAAFQFALWDITHDTDFDLSSGALQIEATASTMALAQTWLGNIVNNIWTPNANVAITALVSANSQNQLYARFNNPGPGNNAVPAPATGLLMLGAGALMLWKRHKAKA